MPSREERRRRILEAGNDRLALITGRVQNLPSTSQNPPSSQETAYLHNISSSSSPPLSAQGQDLKSLSGVSEPHTVLHNDEDKPSDHVLLKRVWAAESIKDDSFDGRSREEPGIKPSEAHGFAVRGKADSSRTLPGAGGFAFSAEQVLATMAHVIDYFSLQQVRAAVKATEQTRMLCSLAVAIIVMLSYLGFPILGSKILKSVILFRPLILLLLTNITFTVSWILFEKQTGLQRTEKEGDIIPSAEGSGWMDEAGKALELALIVQNVMGALLMDCSVYAVIVICFFSTIK